MGRLVWGAGGTRNERVKHRWHGGEPGEKRRGSGPQERRRERVFFLLQNLLSRL